MADLQNNIIGLDEEKLSGLLHELSMHVGDGELEIRLGKFHSQTRFDTDIGYVLYSRLYSFLKKHYCFTSSLCVPLVTMDIKSIYQGKEYRVTICGQEDIDNFCVLDGKTFDLVNAQSVSVISKIPIRHIDDTNYGFRVSLNKEEKVDHLTKEAIVRHGTIRTPLANHRYKRRYSFYPLVEKDGTCDENPFLRFDLTSVQQNDRVSFQFEIEISHTADRNKNGRDVSIILNHLHEFLIFRQDTGYLTSPQVILGVKESFISVCQRFWNSKNFPGMKPVSISGINILDVRDNLKKDYSATWKADGSRYLLFVYKQSLFFVDSNYDVIPTYLIDESHAADDVTLLDGEYIHNADGHGGVYWVFDIFIYRGQNTKCLPLRGGEGEFRIEKMQSFFRLFKAQTLRCDVRGRRLYRSLELREKVYVFDNLEENSARFAEMPDSDGVIFTPQLKSYPTNGVTFSETFKWKKPSHNTIDFLIRFDREKVYGNQRYAVFKLITSRDGTEEEFRPLTETGQRMSIYMYVPRIDGRMSTIGDRAAIQSDTIVECVWGSLCELYNISDAIVDFGFVPYRQRVEKTKRLYEGGYTYTLSGSANATLTAQSIWKSIENPISIRDLFRHTDNHVSTVGQYYKDGPSALPGEQVIFYFHNFVKETLIKEAVAIVGDVPIFAMDVGCGQGGDLRKWNNVLHLESLVMTDLLANNIERMRERYFQDHRGNFDRLKKKKVIFLQADFSKPVDGPGEEREKESFDEFLGMQGTLNIVSSFFCLHYFYESIHVFKNFMWNVNSSMRIGGIWILTLIDGHNIYETELERLAAGEEAHFSCPGSNRSTFSIIKKDADAYCGQYGYEMGFRSLNISGRRKEDYVTEYLVNMDTEIFKEFGFSVCSVKDFLEYWPLFENRHKKKIWRECPRLLDWSRLHKTLIFTKVEDIKNTHSRGGGFEGDIFPKKDVISVSELERQIITGNQIADTGGLDEIFQGRKRKNNADADADAQSTKKREKMTNTE